MTAARGDPPSSGEGQDIMAAIGIPTHEIVLDRDLADNHGGRILPLVGLRCRRRGHTSVRQT